MRVTFFVIRLISWLKWLFEHKNRFKTFKPSIFRLEKNNACLRNKRTIYYTLS